MSETQPKVLLLGDSIRLSYQPYVAEQLKDEATVVGSPDNGRFSLYTQMRLDALLEEFGQPQIIHWNNGLWDVGHCEGRGPKQFSVEYYVDNLRTTLELLGRDAAEAQIIWATMTPVHPNRPFPTEGWSWRNDEIDRYNAAARQLMQSHNIPINDLHAIVAKDPDALMDADQLHLSEQGQRRCADAVAGVIRNVLNGQLS